MNPIEIAYPITLVILGISALASVYRIFIGPTLLDRIIAADVLIITVSSTIVVSMIRNGTMDSVVLVMVASVIGFIGSVTIARFVLERSRIGDPIRQEQS
ncbi:monovalent cation/H+ antiporter complex subunit F [Micrococcoides hystricis]|uniref:Monovalent cation/H+ antiporter complex subunit F n=1 Tax=Micrococcoides hystricis TaxID=1572761 RepID=A0ABV6PCX0_9MICC